MTPSHDTMGGNPIGSDPMPPNPMRPAIRRAMPPGASSRRWASRLPPGPVPAGRMRMFYIASDDVKNVILVTGPPEIIAKAKDIVENRLDKPSPDDKNPQPILVGPPSFENIPLPSGNADGIAKDLQGIFPASSTLQNSSNGPNSIRVFACPEDMDQIKKYIGRLTRAPGAKCSTWAAWTGARTATTLAEHPRRSQQEGRPVHRGDTRQNAVLVNGNAEQVTQVKDLIKVMNGEARHVSGVGIPAA